MDGSAKLKMGLTAAIAATLAITSPAAAQKSKDTLRVAITDPFVVISELHAGMPEAATFYRTVYGNLVKFDEYKGIFVSDLAKAWRQVDDVTLEFDLRDNVKFHNGDSFDADDVVYMIQYLLDPKVKLRYKARFLWIDRAEKLGPHKVRIIAKEPNSIALSNLAYRTPIFNSKVFSKQSIEEQERYGQMTPYGTGPYQVVDTDKNRGVLVERFKGFSGDDRYFRTLANRVHGVPLPDRQTQFAQLITGGIDLVQGVESEAAKELKANPDFEVTALPSGDIVYFALDAAATSGNKALADVRVRRAIWMAINREAIMKHLVVGEEVAERMNALCFKATVGCKFTKPYPAYNPAEAKRLLAEAGYADGFDLKFTIDMSIKDYGVAVAGDLRKIGIRAIVDAVPITVYRNKRAKNEVEIWSVNYPSANQPDANSILTTFFHETAAKTYGSDPIIEQVLKEGTKEFDPGKRADIYARAFDRNNEQIYVMPLLSQPTVIAHSKSVKLERNPLSAFELSANDYGWK